MWATLLAAATAAAAASPQLCTALRAPNGAAAFVYGTLHMDDERLYRLPARAEAAFAQAHTVVLEAELDAAALTAAARRMYFGDTGTLREAAGAELHARTRAVARRHGLPAAQLERMKPWAVATALSTPLPSDRPVLDLALSQRARAQGKRVVGLETADEQLAIFDSMSAPVQLQMLEETVRRYDELAILRTRLLDAYLARDLATVARLAEQSLSSGAPELRQVFRHQLIDARNARMAQRAVPILKQGDVFLAVGALHLPGPDGLLERLRRAEFSLTPGC